MKKGGNFLGRYIFLLVCIALAAWALYRTAQWYYFIPKQAEAEGLSDPREYLTLSEDELDAADDETKAYVLELKKIRKSALSLGLDLQGGVYIVTEVNEDDLREQLYDTYDGDLEEIDENFETEFTDATDRALEVLMNRMDQFGVSEPVIRKTFDGNISIELPGLNNPQMVRDALSKVGKLEFHIVDEDAMEDLSSLGVSVAAGYVLTMDDVPSDYELPEDSSWFPYYENDEFGIPSLQGWYILYDEVSMDGTAIKTANIDTDAYGSYVVGFTLTDEGTDIFAELTGNNIGNRLAIVLDGKVKSAPNINDEIYGSGQISGNFSIDETVWLANILKAGSLPVKLDIVEERVIGPTLGQDSIRNGTKAFIIGTLAVVVFMILWYKVAGLLGVLGLTFNIFFLVAFLGMMNATLTLAGIAGIALTVGMAVDANVIIYQRIREEITRTKAFKHALDNGYENASKTIWDSNLTTLIAAFALYLYGSGNIKGFGITLTFGIISNIFTALFITRLFLDSTLEWFKVKKIWI